MSFLMPGVRLMNRLSYSRKFALVGVLVLIPLVLLIVTALPALQGVADMARSEAAGVPYLQSGTNLLVALQDHRGQMNAALSGDAAARQKAVQAADDVDKAVEALLARDITSGYAFAAHSKLAQIQTDWKALRERSASMSAADSFAAHTELIHRTIELISEFADSSQLTLDPELATFYLQNVLVSNSPPFIEAVGKLRGKMAGILAKRTMSEDDIVELQRLANQVLIMQHDMDTSLEKIYAALPALQTALKPLAANVHTSTSETADLALSQANSSAFAVSSQDYFAKATTAIDAVLKLNDTLAPALEQALMDRYSHARNKVLLNLAVISAMLWLLLYAGLSMRKSITEAVQEIEHAAAAMAEGDLTCAVNFQADDEMGKAAQELNQGRKALSRLLMDVKQLVAQVNESAGQVSVRAGQIATSSETQNEAVSSSAAAIEQLSVSVTHIAELADEADSSASAAGDLAARGKNVAEGASRDMMAISQTVTRASEQISGLNVLADQISGIVNVIREIADQTNLLALNAAIEAARAGEQGRGFAVVADEVRKLAERTAMATQEIGSMITSVQTEAHHAVSSMEESSSKAKSGEQTVIAAANSLQEIHAAVETALQRMNEIANASREQKEASQEIAQNTERVAQMSESNSSNTMALSALAGQMQDLAGNLRGKLDQFRV